MNDTVDPPSRTLPALPTVWRPTRARIILRTIALAVTAIIVGIAVDAPHDGGAPWSPVDRGSVGVCGLILGGLLWTLSRPAVRADEHGITVVNMVRSHRYAWAEVLRVSLRQGDPWATLDLADGTSVGAMGIQPAVGREQAVRAARELRDLVEARGTATEE